MVVNLRSVSIQLNSLGAKLQTTFVVCIKKQTNKQTNKKKKKNNKKKKKKKHTKKLSLGKKFIC